MAHDCATKNPQHTPDLKCPCGCPNCLAGARSDLFDALAAIGKAQANITQQKIDALTEQFKLFIGQKK